MKRILITGRDSYIGISLERWLKKDTNEYQIDTVDMKSPTWREKDFSAYDVVFHVAGIAHVSADPKLEDLYYKVNRDLAVETAKKAKEEGVKQFIFMSSIIIYGDGAGSRGVICRDNEPKPTNFYGSSKLQAEEGIRPLNSDGFRVVILRPPMIYGKGSKGNYPRLAGLAKTVPVFPDFNNKRSMLHVDNLCEFLKIIIDREESGLFFPQNAGYVRTGEMVRLIAAAHGRRIIMTHAFDPLIRLLCIKSSFINKVFGDLVYDQAMSVYEAADYRIRSLEESIKLTEKKQID